MSDVFSPGEIRALILNFVGARSQRGTGASEEEIERFVEACAELRVGASLLSMLLSNQLAGDFVDGKLSFAAA